MPALTKTLTNINTQKMWTAQEVAEFLSVTEQTLYNWRQAKIRIEFYRIGRRILYDPADVKAYKASARVAAAKEVMPVGS